MRTVSLGLGLVTGATLLSGCSLFVPPLRDAVPVDPAPFAPVVAQYAGSVARVLTTTCSGLPLSGSGFVVGPHMVLTGAHVVDGGRQASLRLPGRAPVPASVIGIDPGRDTALLHTDAELPAPPIALADPATTAPGTEVVALGYPLGEAAQRTDPARITAVTDEAMVNGFRMGDLVVVDASLRPGVSGGPALDVQGRARGMVVAAIGGRGGRDSAMTVALAIPTASLAGSLDRWRDAPPAASASCPDERPASAAPALALSVGGSVDAELAHTVWLFGQSVTSGQLRSAWAMLGGDLQVASGGFDRWSVANADTRWTGLDVLGTARDGDRATLRARVRSVDATGRCRVREDAYGLRFVFDSWRLDSLDAGEPAPCG
jgi:hypothetical protein